MNYEWRVSKYNPAKRDNHGVYMDRAEWTSFSDVGKTVTLDEYERTEDAYIKGIMAFMKSQNVTFLCANHVEGRSDILNGQQLDSDDIARISRDILREKYWCTLESEEMFIHFGYDFYMYLGSNNESGQAKEAMEQLGLFVEPFISPYHIEK